MQLVNKVMHLGITQISVSLRLVFVEVLVRRFKEVWIILPDLFSQQKLHARAIPCQVSVPHIFNLVVAAGSRLDVSSVNGSSCSMPK